MIIANVHKAKTELSKLLAKLDAGETVFIAKNGDPLYEIIKSKPKKKSFYGILKGKINVPDNFDDEDLEINKLFYGE